MKLNYIFTNYPKIVTHVIIIFLAFDFKLVDNFENNKNQIFRTNKTDFKSVFINSYNSNNKQLRAPPSIS